MANKHQADQQPLQQAEQHLRIPVIQEELHLGKRIVETGRGVRLHKTVSEEALRIDEMLTQQDLQIEHVPRGEWIESGTLPVNRYEGATLVVPVLEEVLVVEKRWRLNEEIRITAKSQQRPVSQRVVLRKENIAIERFDQSQQNEPQQHTKPQRNE
jgi:stress response protein YsnF